MSDPERSTTGVMDQGKSGTRLVAIIAALIVLAMLVFDLNPGLIGQSGRGATNVAPNNETTSPAVLGSESLSGSAMPLAPDQKAAPDQETAHEPPVIPGILPPGIRPPGADPGIEPTAIRPPGVMPPGAQPPADQPPAESDPTEVFPTLPPVVTPEPRGNFPAVPPGS